MLDAESNAVSRVSGTQAAWRREALGKGKKMLDQFGSNGSGAPALEDEASRPMPDRRPGIAESNDWAMAIGRSIIAFARIEHAATLLVRQCTPDAIGHRAARLDLSARLAYIDELLRYGGLTTQEERRWGHLVSKTEELREQHRTILAYGAPLPGPIEFTGRFVIIRESHGPRQSLLTLAQIERTAEDIEAAHAERGEAPDLSRRELEVLRLIAEGVRTRAIAKELGISVVTVEAHRRSIMRKLDLHTVAELTRYAVRQRLIEP
jgi:DNA-binding CsgD family transcriptional regulator